MSSLKALALTSDVDKSTYDEGVYGYITPKMFQKINEKIPGKNGNWRTLLYYLIMQKQNSSDFRPAEETICKACGFTSSSRYREARDKLCELGFLTHIPYKELRINYQKIME